MSTYNTYVGDGEKAVYVISFDYADRSHAKAYVTGLVATFVFLDAGTIRFDVTPHFGASIVIRRETPSEQPIVDFSDGNARTGEDLDSAFRQSLYVAQEAFDQASLSPLINEDAYTVTQEAAVQANRAAASEAVAVSSKESATASELSATSSAASAASSAVDSAASATQALSDRTLSEAAVVTTSDNLTNSNAAALATSQDLGATNADVLLTNADVVSTNNNVVSTNSDAASTASNLADVIAAESNAVAQALASSNSAIASEESAVRSANSAASQVASTQIEAEEGSDNSSYMTPLRVVQSIVSNVPQGTPTGSIQPYAGAVEPDGWLFMGGQAVSRSNFSALFAAISTTYGAGDGSTTFNVPDARGRSLFGRDDMGGTAANRVTTGGSGLNGASLGAVGGGESATLTAAQMPTHTHTQNAHSHQQQSAGNGGGTAPSIQRAPSVGINVYGPQFEPSTVAVVASNQNNGSSQAHSKMPPALIINYIIKT
jgi:microcystin-dependent protein